MKGGRGEGERNGRDMILIFFFLLYFSLGFFCFLLFSFVFLLFPSFPLFLFQAHQGLRNEAEGAVFTIDVGLNPWEFPGELLLLKTAMAKPKMIINWREGDWTPQDDDEMR